MTSKTYDDEDLLLKPEFKWVPTEAEQKALDAWRAAHRTSSKSTWKQRGHR